MHVRMQHNSLPGQDQKAAGSRCELRELMQTPGTKHTLLGADARPGNVGAQLIVSGLPDMLWQPALSTDEQVQLSTDSGIDAR